MKITTKLYGGDLERLADCIKFAAKLGLAMDDDTQCGLNENSGNVWLWSEDWTGSVYQNLGNTGPYVLWSCPYCGNEQDCETMQEADDLTNWSDKHDNCCSASMKELTQ